MTITVAKLIIHSVIIWNAQSEDMQSITIQLPDISEPPGPEYVAPGPEYSSDLCQLQGGPLPEFVDYLRDKQDPTACDSCRGVCGYASGKFIFYCLELAKTRLSCLWKSDQTVQKTMPGLGEVQGELRGWGLGVVGEEGVNGVGESNASLIRN